MFKSKNQRQIIHFKNYMYKIFLNLLLIIIIGFVVVATIMHVTSPALMMRLYNS